MARADALLAFSDQSDVKEGAGQAQGDQQHPKAGKGCANAEQKDENKGKHDSLTGLESFTFRNVIPNSIPKI